MKRIFLLMAVAIALIAGFACSQEETEVKISKTEQAAFDELRMQIAALNASYGVDEASRADKTNKKKKGRVLAVVSSDLTGACDAFDLTWGPLFWLKMLIKGVQASVDTASELYEESLEDQEATSYVPVKAYDNPNTIWPEGLPHNPTLLDSVGYAHNEIIVDLYRRFGDDLYTFDEQTRLSHIRQQTAIYTGDNRALTVPGLRTDFNNILKTMRDDNIEESYSAFIRIRPHITNELLVLKEFSYALSQFESDEEILEYTQAHNGLIMISDIMEGSKQFIKAATQIGCYSTLMWKPVNSLTDGDEIVEP